MTTVGFTDLVKILISQAVLHVESPVALHSCTDANNPKTKFKSQKLQRLFLLFTLSFDFVAECAESISEILKRVMDRLNLSLIEKGTMNVMRRNRRCYEKQIRVYIKCR
jgi:hypothetical protein